MALRNYTDKATLTTITSALNGTDAPGTSTTVTVASVANLPVAPFTAALDLRQPTEEVVLVTAVAGSTLTITRGYDGTTVSAHTSGTATIEHVTSAIDFTEANAHVNATTGVHGATGALVDVGSTQTISGLKTFSAVTTHSAALVMTRGQFINTDGGTVNTAVGSEATAGASFTGSAVSDKIIKEPNGQHILLGTHGLSGVQNPQLSIGSQSMLVNDQGTMREVPRGVLGYAYLTANTAQNITATALTVVTGTRVINGAAAASGTMALTFTVQNGLRYRVVWNADLFSSVAGDVGGIGLTYTAGTGTATLTSSVANIVLTTASSGFGQTVQGIIEAGLTGTITISAAAKRLSGTGNVNLALGSTLIVDHIG